MKNRFTSSRIILYNWPKPQIREIFDPDRVEMILCLSNFIVKSDFPSETTKKTTKKTTEKILNTLRVKPQISNKELAELCDITKDGIYYHMKKMKDNGIIRRIGPDKGGHWEIIKE